MAISLGSRLLDSSSSLPGSRRTGPARGIDRTNLSAGRIHSFLLDLAPGGVCLAKPVARPAGELLPHRFTLTARRPSEAMPRRQTSSRRFAFCCTFPDLTAGGRYPSPRPVEPGLSSRRCRLKGRCGGPWRLGRQPSGPLRTICNHIANSVRQEGGEGRWRDRLQGNRNPERSEGSRAGVRWDRDL